MGPGYGYFPNAIKTVLLAKSEHQDEARRIFSGTGITIRTDGSRYLGGALGEKSFCQQFMSEMVEKWSKQIRALAEITETQPHAAYSVFTKALSLKWKYHIRSTQTVLEMVAVLDDLINTVLLPAFTGRRFDHDRAERSLLALPMHLGGLAIPSVTNDAAREYQASTYVTDPMVTTITSTQKKGVPNLEESEHQQIDALEAISECKKRAHSQRKLHQQTLNEVASHLEAVLPQKYTILISSAGKRGYLRG